MYSKNDFLRVIDLGPRLTWGLEHTVYVNEGVVYKRPNPIGKVWQPMDSETVMRDLQILSEFEFPIVPTILYVNPTVRKFNGKEVRTSYVMEQPFIPDIRELHFSDLKENKKVRNTFHDIMLKAEAIHEKYPDLGVDLLGGANWIDSLKAINPWTQSFPGIMRNLFILREDLIAPRSFQGRISKNEKFASKGDVLLCDVRLFNACSNGKLLARTRGRIPQIATQLEYGAIWGMLEHVGFNSPIQQPSVIRKLGRFLISLAIPKMEHASPNH